MATSLQLDWSRCPNGYEVYQRPDQPGHTLADSVIGGLQFRPRTQQRERRRFFSDAGSNAVVLKFLRAESDADLLKFFKEYGLPGIYRRDGGEEGVDEVRGLQINLRALLASKNLLITQFSPVSRVTLGLAAKDGLPLLVMQAETLSAFMHAEAALMLSGNSGIMTCENCGQPFLTKSGRAIGSKRTDAKYCSPNCRLVAHRRNKGGQHVSP